MFLLSTNKYIFTYSFSAQVIQFSAKPHTIHSWGPAHLVTNGLWLSATDHITCVCLVAQSCPTLCDPMDSSTPDSSVHGDSPGKNTGVGYHALLQGIFLTQGWNPGLPDCTWILYCLSHLGISKSKEFEYDKTLKLCCKIICGSLELSSIPKLPGDFKDHLSRPYPCTCPSMTLIWQVHWRLLPPLTCQSFKRIPQYHSATETQMQLPGSHPCESDLGIWGETLAPAFSYAT